MMKKLVVLFIAVAALFAFSACEPYAVTVDEVNDVGIQNYNLSGKTLVRETYGYITKTVETMMAVTTGGTTKTTTSRETVKIPCSVKTDTITFAADGTYTSTEAVTYHLAGADGDYRATTVQSTPSPGTIVTTMTSYSEYNYNGNYVTARDEFVTGRAGKTISTSSSAGTWERITRQENYSDSITWEYYLTETSSSSSSTPIIPTNSEDADEIEGTTNTDKVTWTTSNNTTNTVNAPSDEPSSLGDVYRVRKDANGNDVVYIGGVYIDGDYIGGNYTVQPQQ